MLGTDMRAVLHKRQWEIVSAVLLLGLLAYKYFWTAFSFELPLGYDVGIYRYLFLHYRDAFPFIPALDPWALEQPPGFFLLMAIPLQLLPVEWFLGWIWNLMPIILTGTLAWIWTKKSNVTAGLLILLFSLLSLAQYYGFLAMYWKTFVALLFMIITFRLIEKKSYFAILAGALTIAVHQQTGTLFIVVLLSWGFFHALRSRTQASYVLLGLISLAILLGILVYIPVWQTAVLPHLRRLAEGGSLPPGSFPTIGFFFVHGGVLLLFGLLGLIFSLRSEKGTLWQWSAFWSLLFVVTHFFFYRRFFLQLDFFLLPFAASGFLMLWNKRNLWSTRISIILLLAVQAVASLYIFDPGAYPLWCSGFPVACQRYPATPVLPDFGSALLEEIKKVEPLLPHDATVLSLEPMSTPWVRGWLPYHTVAGPGVFSSPWDEAGWEQFLFGSSKDRRLMLANLPPHLYLHVTPTFLRYYGDSAESFLSDPCFKEIISPSFIRVHCP